jgi:PAS domain S-box-containing protein
MVELKRLYGISRDLNVLYAEDDEKIRDQYSKFFQKIFKTVDSAQDGEEALNKYHSFFKNNDTHYDLVISDIMMPKMTGTQLSEELLKYKADQQILIISAYNDSDRLQELMDIGIHFFIHKPMKFKNMIQVLEKICSFITHQKEEDQKIKKLQDTISKLENDFTKAVKEKRNFQDDVIELYALSDNYAITSFTNPQGVIIEVNSEFLAISGYTRDEIIGEHFEVFRDEDTSKEILESMKQGVIHKCEIKNKKHSFTEEYYWTALVVVPMIKNDEIYGYKFVEENITEQRKIGGILDDILQDCDDDSDILC